MSLDEQLAKMREASAGRIPPEKRAVMEAATQALRDSDMLDQVAKVGDAMPSFELPDGDGELVRSADLLAKGPLVLTFFRGAW